MGTPDDNGLDARGLVESFSEAVFVRSADGTLAYANDALCRLLGVSREEVVGSPFADLFDGESGRALERSLGASLGQQRPMPLLSAVTTDGQDLDIEIVLLPRDSDGAVHGILREALGRERFRLAFAEGSGLDYLTGIPNRARFSAELTRLLALLDSEHDTGALVVVDLDKFRDINDTIGHAMADSIIIDVSKALVADLRSEDLLARIGGDEFAILLPGVDESSALEMAHRALDTIENLRGVAEDSHVRLTASIGLALYPEHGVDADEMLACADLARYQAKDSGGGCVTLYAERGEWQGRLSDRRTWSRRIGEALQEGRIVPYAQPILDIGERRIYKYELLCRMFDDDMAAVPPGQFLSAADHIGLSLDIDRLMLTTAVELLSAYAQDGLRINVNISPRGFSSPGLVDEIRELFERHAVCPECLGIEILETMVISNVAKAQQTAEQLTSLGCRMVLDDFGTGSSSFFHLRQLRLDELKIDGMYIRNLATNRTDRYFVKAIVELAHGLGIETTAEYVHDARSVQLLDDLGVHYAQGFHIHRPGPAWEIIGATLGETR